MKPTSIFIFYVYSLNCNCKLEQPRDDWLLCLLDIYEWQLALTNKKNLPSDTCLPLQIYHYFSMELLVGILIGQPTNPLPLLDFSSTSMRQEHLVSASAWARLRLDFYTQTLRLLTERVFSDGGNFRPWSFFTFSFQCIAYTALKIKPQLQSKLFWRYPCILH